MIKYAIPLLLLSVVLVTGIFAFMPIQQATTVHTTIFSNTAKLVDSELTTANTTDQNVTITCPTTSDGCQILELYLRETANVGNVQINVIDLVIDGQNINGAIDVNPDDVANGVTILVTEAGGIALGNGDTLTLNTSDGDTDNAARYTVKVVGVIEGDTAEFGIAFT